MPPDTKSFSARHARPPLPSRDIFWTSCTRLYIRKRLHRLARVVLSEIKPGERVKNARVSTSGKDLVYQDRNGRRDVSRSLFLPAAPGQPEPTTTVSVTHPPRRRDLAVLNPPRRENESVSRRFFSLPPAEINSRALFFAEAARRARRGRPGYRSFCLAWRMLYACFLFQSNFNIQRARFAFIRSGFHLSPVRRRRYRHRRRCAVVFSPSLPPSLVMTRGSAERILNLDNASFVLYARLFSPRSSLPFRFLCRFAT